MNVKTYEGFLDLFRKGLKGDPETGRFPKDIEVGGEVSDRAKHFFETTEFSDFNYIIQEITDEYGGGEISYEFESEFACLRITEKNDRFEMDEHNLKFMMRSQNHILDRVGKYANITVYIEGFKLENEGSMQTHLHNLYHNKPEQSKFISEVGERLMDMCEDIQSYEIGNYLKSSTFVISFNF